MEWTPAPAAASLRGATDLARGGTMTTSRGPMTTSRGTMTTSRGTMTTSRGPVDGASAESLADGGDAVVSLAHAVASRELFSPLDVECAARATATPDCSGLASRLDDTIGSCSVLLPARGRTAVLARGRSRGAAHRVAVGTIGAAPELFLPDAHAPPLLWPARLGLAPSFAVARLHAPPAGAPPATPSRRIDRPPRA
jgi:hypothetical protein